MYTKYINTLKKLQEKFLESRQILKTIEQVWGPDVGAFVMIAK